MGLTEYGYSRATYDDILNAKILKAKELFGEDIETSDQTPLGKFIRINAFDQAKAEEEAEQIYYARFPSTASGVSLDRLCVFVGITRNPATAARYTVDVTGTVGYTVPIGFIVGTESGVKFYNLNDEVIGEDGTCTITVDCDTAGTVGNVDYAEITEIVNPNVDVFTVAGASLVSIGNDAESDYSLRNRFFAAREGQGSCTANAIKAALMRVETVTSASVIVNESDTEDADGRPPHSFECYVSGGEDHHKEIAETIFDKKPIGVWTHGDNSYTLTDESGQDHIIKFSHTTTVPIFVYVSVKVTTSFEGEDGIREIKDNLASYINSLGVGGSVVSSALYGKIHSVAGVKEVSTLDLSAEKQETVSGFTIEISSYEIAQCSTADISVDVEVV